MHNVLEPTNQAKKKYSVHEPDMVLIKKGFGIHNTHFGNVVSISVTHKEGLVVDATTLEGRPYDGHTLKEAIERTESNTGVPIEQVIADQGYRGHDVTETVVNLSTAKKDIPSKLRKDLDQRTVVEAMIGHMKNEGRLNKCTLKGIEGSKFHSLMCGCGHNLRLILNTIKSRLKALAAVPPPNPST